MDAVKCLFCGAEESTVTVTLDADHTFHCDDCEADFTVEEVRAKLAGWERVLAWVEASPFRCAKAVEAAAG